MNGPLQGTQQVSVLAGTTACDTFLSIQNLLLCSKLNWLHVVPNFELGLEGLLRQFFLIRPHQTNLISNLKHICNRNMF